jgi:hypothetical protein
MSNHMQSELSHEGRRGNGLLHLALDSLMAFAAVAGYAANASAQSDSEDATIDAEVTASITLTITGGTINFGTINPATDPTSGTRVEDPNVGAYFVSPPVTVTVNSNVAWSGTTARADVAPPSTFDTTGRIFLNEGTAPAVVGDFTTPVGPVGTPNTWETAGALGSTVAAHYLSLFIPRDQAPGTVSTTVTYTITANP